MKKQCGDDDLLQEPYSQLPVMTKTDTNHNPAAKTHKKPKANDIYKKISAEEYDELTEEKCEQTKDGDDKTEVDDEEDEEDYCE